MTKIYVITMSQYEDWEVLPYAHKTPEAARAAVERRTGQKLEWQEHNSHGHSWAARTEGPGLSPWWYTVSEIEVAE